MSERSLHQRLPGGWPAAAGELPAAGRLAAWGAAAIAGAVSPDEAASAVSGAADAGHRVAGLPGEAAPVTVAYAVGRLRAAGVRGLRLVLPVPGDVAGLPGPPVFNERAVEAGAVVLTVGGPTLGFVEAARGAWTGYDVALDPRTPLTVADAARELGAAVRDGAEELARLDVAGWDPAAASALGMVARSGAARRPSLPDPPAVDAARHALLEQGLRMVAVVEVARSGTGAALTVGEIAARDRVLAGLAAAARRAVEAACSTGVT